VRKAGSSPVEANGESAIGVARNRPWRASRWGETMPVLLNQRRRTSGDQYPTIAGFSDVSRRHRRTSILGAAEITFFYKRSYKTKI